MLTSNDNVARSMLTMSSIHTDENRAPGIHGGELGENRVPAADAP